MSYIGNPPVISATRTLTEVIATAGQTVFYPTSGYTVGYLDVFLNGSQLQSGDFTATNGSSVTLASGCTVGDELKFVAWGTLMVTGAGIFPFYKSDGNKDVINLSASSKLPFFDRSSVSKDITLTL